MEFFFCFFLLQILTLMYFFKPFCDLCYITRRKLYVQTLFSNILHDQSSYKQDRVFLHSWWDPRQMDHKVFKKE